MIRKMLQFNKEYSQMDTFATTVYVITEEVLRILNVQDNHQSIMSNSEVITFAIVTAKFFSGNCKMARYMCHRTHLFQKILSNSRLNRRIHNISWDCWIAIFRFLSLIAKQAENTCYFAVDSFPIMFCQKSRIDRRKCFLEPSTL
jgi:hypothetical protein